MMRTVNVSLPTAAYSIQIGSGLLENVEHIMAVLAQPRVMIVTNEKIAGLFLARLSLALAQKNIQVQHVILPDGEAHKNWHTLNIIFDAMLNMQCERNTTVIALGGGVIGDIAGFAAATFQRGVPYIQIPTTLLAQVDSSVGGKTGINHPMGKNMIGAFYQPKLVLADTVTLKTLPPRELSAGLAEIIKCSLINDPEFLSWLEQHMDSLVACDEEKLGYAIERACRNKVKVVMADEKEMGVRALLNLGHTFGHAIELGLGYGQWLHGEAVAVGLVMAAVASQHLGYLQQAEVTRLILLLQRANLPVQGPNLGMTRYMKLMAQDKKVQSGNIRFILLKALGEAFIGELPATVIEATLKATTA
jgi:3-dehydroquinate synthase